MGKIEVEYWEALGQWKFRFFDGGEEVGGGSCDAEEEVFMIAADQYPAPGWELVYRFIEK
jgi:hypothetical protein